MSQKFLTKSRFKIGSECPTKLFFNDRKEYGNRNSSDEFLRALSDGGYQVGELAKLYFPGGTEVKEREHEKAARITRELLEKPKAIIYEASFLTGNLFVRADIVTKDENGIKLYEVKAKSFDSTEEFEVFDKRSKKVPKLNSKWNSYILDLAYQTYVIEKSLKVRVVPHLMMADKSRTATVDGLNQIFLIKRNADGRTHIIVNEKANCSDLGVPILTAKELNEEVRKVLQLAQVQFGPSFEQLIENLTKAMKAEELIDPPVGVECKHCEFRISDSIGGKSGFKECWQKARRLKEEDFKKEFVFDVWDNRRSSAQLEEGKVFANDLAEDDLGIKEREDNKAGLSRTERQLEQVKAAKQLNPKVVTLPDAMAAELASFNPPYHFIDFETTMVAIPFHKGRRPYEQVAFQFSHHVVHTDGRIEERTPFLYFERGKFPNFEFVRALKKALEGDNGVVFRFAAHENTVLNQIFDQLAKSEESDKEVLMKWIRTLTSPPKETPNLWTPSRQFIDMRDLTLRYYYLPETKGSNSIKKILPAVLNVMSSDSLRKFDEWIVRDSETRRVADPYKLLPPIFTDVDKTELEKFELRFTEEDSLADGGAAMMAWARMQFTEMSDVERQKLREALLRYCQLDTLAMVMIWEWWKEVSQSERRKKVS